VERFLEIVSRLATFDEEISEKEKTSKLLRTLLDSFAPIAMVAQKVDMDFEKLLISVHAEIAREKNSKESTNSPSGKFMAANLGTRSNNRDNKRQRGGRTRGGRIRKNYRDVNCFECGKHSHYAADCWHRADPDQLHQYASRGRTRGRSGRGRGRSRGYYAYPSPNTQDPIQQQPNEDWNQHHDNTNPNVTGYTGEPHRNQVNSVQYPNHRAETKARGPNVGREDGPK